METSNETTKKARVSNPFALTSLILGVAPIIMIITIFVFSVIGFQADAAGGSWALFFLVGSVAVVFTILVDVLAIVFGIVAITRQKKLFSWVGIILVFAQVLFLVII